MPRRYTKRRPGYGRKKTLVKGKGRRRLRPLYMQTRNVSIDYHKFKLRQVIDVIADASGGVSIQVSPYSLSQNCILNGAPPTPLNEIGNLQNLFDSYRLVSSCIKYTPFFNVESLSSGGVPPFYICWDPDQTGDIGTSKDDFIEHKHFAMRKAEDKWNYKINPPRRPGNGTSGSLDKGWMNLQAEANQLFGNIYCKILDTGVITVGANVGTVIIEQIVEFKNRK